MYLWWDHPIQITKKMIHGITGFPMLNKDKTTKTLGRVELTKRNLAEWDGRGMNLNGVIHIEIKFSIHVISHKLYSLSIQNNIPYEVVDLALKVVKNNLSFNLVELLLSQLGKNMESIQVSKNNSCKFGSLLTCLFFYVQKFFPSKGTMVWRKDTPIFYQINEFMAKMGENFQSIMDAYFETFKEKMQRRYRIPKNLVEDYK